MEGATETEKNQLNDKDELKKNKQDKTVHFEDLDGTGASQPADPGLHLDPEKSKTVFMNLINVDEKAQVTLVLQPCMF